MGKRIGVTTREHLIGAPLPEQTETYTVISHEFIIKTAKETLESRGFEVVRELYRCTRQADVAQGVYHLKFDGDVDPEMGMMFAWANSYDKTMRFKCAVGGYVNVSGSVLVPAKMASWDRKHTGSAKDATRDTMIQYIEDAEKYYSQLVEDKKVMKTILVDKKKCAELLGRIYFEYELLNSEQLSVARDHIRKPQFDYNAPANSLWTMYNAMIFALQKSHPKTWMDQQRLIHWFLTDHFGINPEPKDPAQITIHQVIEEETKKEEPVIFHTTVLEEPVMATTNPPWEESDVQTEKEVKTVTLEDPSWPCLGCGKMQPEDAVFHDGQLCTECFNNTTE